MRWDRGTAWLQKFLPVVNLVNFPIPFSDERNFPTEISVLDDEESNFCQLFNFLPRSSSHYAMIFVVTFAIQTMETAVKNWWILVVMDRYFGERIRPKLGRTRVGKGKDDEAWNSSRETRH